MTTARICSILALLILFHSLAAADDKLRLIIPEPSTVYLQEGKRTASLIFSLAANTEPPAKESITLTDAYSGTNKISAGNMHFEWQGSLIQSSSVQVLTGQISVEDSAVLEPEAEYKGALIFASPDNAPQQVIKFTLVEHSAASVEVSPDKIDAIADPLQLGTIALRLRNTGKTAITKVEAEPFNLTDTQHGNRTPGARQTVDIGHEVWSPWQYRTVQVNLPQPVLAGAYTGTLNLILNGRNYNSVPLTVRSRGPRYIIPYLPLILFVVILAAGGGLSWLLELWFSGGGLKRAEANVSLRNSQQAFLDFRSFLDKWEAPHDFHNLTQTRVHLLTDLALLEGVVARARSTDPDQLAKEAAEFAVHAVLDSVLETYIKVAATLLASNSTDLPAAIADFDAVAPNISADQYRTALDDKLKKHTAPHPPSPPAAIRVAAVTTLTTSQAASAKDYEKEIILMSWLQRGVIILVVLLVAVETKYIGNFTFGSARDYIEVFLWSLGLTQTGTQMLAKARSSRP